jgi:hypothetical protein
MGQVYEFGIQKILLYHPLSVGLLAGHFSLPKSFKLDLKPMKSI